MHKYITPETQITHVPTLMMKRQGARGVVKSQNFISKHFSIYSFVAFGRSSLEKFSQYINTLRYF